jgi:hypothetical protein
MWHGATPFAVGLTNLVRAWPVVRCSQRIKVSCKIKDEFAAVQHFTAPTGAAAGSAAGTSGRPGAAALQVAGVPRGLQPAGLANGAAAIAAEPRSAISKLIDALPSGPAKVRIAAWQLAGMAACWPGRSHCQRHLCNACADYHLMTGPMQSACIAIVLSLHCICHAAQFLWLAKHWGWPGAASWQARQSTQPVNSR